MKQKVIRISHKDMNEYIKQYAEKALAEKQVSNSDEISASFDTPRTPTLRDEEVAFILAVMDDVIADDDHEAEMIESIKNTLNNSSETQKNEKR